MAASRKTKRWYETRQVFTRMGFESEERQRLLVEDVRSVQGELGGTINNACCELRRRIGGEINLSSYLDCLEAARDKRGQYSKKGETR